MRHLGHMDPGMSVGLACFPPLTFVLVKACATLVLDKQEHSPGELPGIMWLQPAIHSLVCCLWLELDQSQRERQSLPARSAHRAKNGHVDASALMRHPIHFKG